MKRMMTVVAVAAMAATALADLKVATVNMMELVKFHPSYENNKSLLTGTEKDYKKRIDKMNAELDAIQSEGKQKMEEAQNPMIAAAAKAKIEKELMAIQNRYVEKQQKLRAEAMRVQQDLQDLEARLLKTQTDDIRKHVDAFAKKGGYDLIFDSAATIYFNGSLDVTDEILKVMGVDPKAARAKKAADEGK